jgi:hypothetical protein
VHSSRRASRLLGGFVHRGLTPALGRAAAARVVHSADGRYVPPPALARTRAGRFNLQTAAYLLAVRDALIDAGIPAGQAEDLLGDLMYRMMRRLHRPIDAVAAVLRPSDARPRRGTDAHAHARQWRRPVRLPLPARLRTAGEPQNAPTTNVPRRRWLTSNPAVLTLRALTRGSRRGDRHLPRRAHRPPPGHRAW